MLNRIKKSDLESELQHYKDINEQIKELETQRDNLKNALVTSYFAKHSDYISKDGGIRASYKAQIRSMFDSVEFRKDHEKLYKDYCNEKEFFQFLVK